MSRQTGQASAPRTHYQPEGEPVPLCGNRVNANVSADVKLVTCWTCLTRVRRKNWKATT